MTDTAVTLLPHGFDPEWGVQFVVRFKKQIEDQLSELPLAVALSPGTGDHRGRSGSQAAKDHEAGPNKVKAKPKAKAQII